VHLYGSPTSPYVRRVRIVADALGVPYGFTDVFTEAGQAAMRKVNPLWKVPAVELDGKVLWDSQAILDALVRRHGWGPLRPPVDAEDELQLVLAVNGALDSSVNVFYLRREGVDVDAVPYLVKQQQRVGSALDWVADRLKGTSFVDGRPGFAEIVLFTTLDWMRFRSAWDVAAHPRLDAFRLAWADRWADTAPR